MSSETAAAFQWVASTMQADTALMAAATGGVWNGTADIGTAPPFASFGRQSGIDVTTMTKVRLWAEILLQIKAVGPNSGYAALVIIANRIDELFKDRRNVGLPSGGILACYREQELAYEEPSLINGVAWSNLGGLYRIELMGS